MYPINVEIDDAQVERLARAYKRAYKDILKELNGATAFTKSHRTQILRQIELILKQLSEKTGKVLDNDIPKLYKSGADDAIDQLKNIGADIGVSGGFNRVHQRAIAALIDETGSSFAIAMTNVGRDAQRLLRHVVREEILQQLATSQIRGDPLQRAKKYIKGILADEGLSALKDSGGRTWELDRYAEMLYRTKLVESRNRGLVNRMAENGYDLVQVSNHAAECKLCAPWEGKPLSISGATPGYPTLAEAESAGLFHPNCRHAINTLIPSLARQTHAYSKTKETIYLDPWEFKKASGVKNKQTRAKIKSIVTQSGITLRQPSSTNDIKKMSEGVRYNAAFQLDGARQLAGAEGITNQLIEEIDAIDVSSAKSPIEAAHLIITELPKSMKVKPIVEQTILQWGNTLQQAFIQKGLAARETANRTAPLVYRAVGNASGKSVLGNGTYVAFTEGNVLRYGDEITQYRLSQQAKLLDLRSAEKLGLFTDSAIQDNSDLWLKILEDKGEDAALGEVMKVQAKKMGFDGIRGDDKAFGTVIFDDTLLSKVRTYKKS